MTSFNLNYLIKELISKYHRIKGSGIQRMNVGGRTIQSLTEGDSAEGFVLLVMQGDLQSGSFGFVTFNLSLPQGESKSRSFAGLGLGGVQGSL